MSIARHASLQLSALLRLLLARIGSPRESSPAEDGVEPRRVVQPGPWASHLPLGTARLRITGRRDASRADAARSGGDAGHMPARGGPRAPAAKMPPGPSSVVFALLASAARVRSSLVEEVTVELGQNNLPLVRHAHSELNHEAGEFHSIN